MYKGFITLVFTLFLTIHCLSQNAGSDNCVTQTEQLLQSARVEANKGNSQIALEVLTKGLEEPKTAKCRGLILLELGIQENRNNKLVSSVEHLDEALKIFEKYKMFDEQMTANNIIGGCYYVLGDFDITAKYTIRAIRIAKRNGLTNRLGTLYNNLAGALRPLQEYDSALTYSEKSIDLFKKNEDYKGLLHALSTKAGIMLDQENYEEAIALFNQAIEIGTNKKLLNHYIESDCLYGLATCYFNIGKNSEALNHANEAFKLAMQDDHLTISKESSKLLYQLWKNLENIDSAYYYQSTYIDIESKIQSAENLSKLNRLAIRETERQLYEKAQEAEQQKYFTLLVGVIAVLLFLLIVSLFLYYRKSNELNNQLKDKNETIEKANEQLSQQRDKLDTLNKLKDKMFSAVIHDFKTPMNNLEGMLNLLIKKHMTPDEAVYISKNILNDLTKSRLSINSAIAWIKTQLKGDLHQNQTIELNSFISEVNAYHRIDIQQKNLNLETTINQDIQFESDKELLFIILNNLITNAIKFSNPGSRIHITTNLQIKNLNITVADEGIGMTKTELNNLFSFSNNSKKGTSSETGSGLGLIICKELIDNLKGTLSAKSEKGMGTSITISIPLDDIGIN